MWPRRLLLLLLRPPGDGLGRQQARSASSIRIRPKYNRGALDDPKQQFASLPGSVMSNKLLVALDFDKTIINVNSDTFIMQALPHGGKEAAPFSGLQWTQYMQKVFDLLHQSGISASTVLRYLDMIPFTPGMPELLRELDTHGHEAIIISDCNRVFIEHILEKSDLRHLVKKVFTNPSYFDDDEHLHVDMYQRQDWCKLCAVNLCKGHVLREYVDARRRDGIEFKAIAYVGDGLNDFCPMLTLQPGDLAFPRMDFPCHKAILKGCDRKLLAKLYPWKDAFQIQDVVFVEMNN